MGTSTSTTIAADTGTVRVTMNQFSPADAERITLVPNAMQRKWRHRGFLAERPTASPSSWDLFSLAELMVLHLLAARVGPLMARSMATVCSIGIVWHALAEYESYEGDAHLVYCWDPEKFAAINEHNAKWRAIVAKLDQTGGTKPLGRDHVTMDAGVAAELTALRAAGGPNWTDQADLLESTYSAPRVSRKSLSGSSAGGQTARMSGTVHSTLHSKAHSSIRELRAVCLF